MKKLKKLFNLINNIRFISKNEFLFKMMHYNNNQSIQHAPIIHIIIETSRIGLIRNNQQF